MARKKQPPAKIEEKLQALLAEARSILVVAQDLAEQHDLEFEFLGLKREGGEISDLDGNTDDLNNEWNPSGCSF